MNKFLVVVFGMSLVTYVPRVLPMLLLKDKGLPKSLRNFLSYIPYAVLGALIFPGILDSTGSLITSISGGIAALIVSLFKVNVIFVVFAGILTSYIFKLLI
jgi:branched-subunit amino acid transport protein